MAFKMIRFPKHALNAFAALVVLSGCGTSSDMENEPRASENGSTAPITSTQQAVSTSSDSFDKMMSELANSLDAKVEAGIPVPVPADAGGGYTHEQHKENAKTIYQAGMLFQQTGQEKYKTLIRDVLFDYADLYPGLDIHPKATSSNKGRLFWQGLNEAWWLVYTIQGYETVRDALSEDERLKIENGVLNPMADFLSVGSPQTFDLIHNHATWATAGVGMTGYVLEQPERVEQALMGLDKTGEKGFLRQLDLLFSPDGYYAEGPYYQRYALMPFVLFSQAIERNEPERAIFEHRDGIVMKAIETTVQQSYAGRFFPINDAIREKGLNTVELKYGLAIAYDVTGDPKFLGAANLQNGTVPTLEGRKLASAIEEGKAEPFAFKSMALSDGPDGDEGALVILRSGPNTDDAAVIMKATTQGLGHGHFDKLGLLYFDNENEIVADYGAARFLNVEPKNGGRYLPENESWAKQSVAHNTLVVDETSHFRAKWRYAQEFHPDMLAYDDTGPVQFSSAEIDSAYPGVTFRRTIAMVPKPGSDNPYIVDIVQAFSDDTHQYDLPIHFKGQLIETGFGMTHSTDVLRPLGAENGYQHLWDRARSEALDSTENLSWLLNDQFYSLTFATSGPVEAILAELGANDPDHNLRHEQALLLRASGQSTVFVSVFERHGRYDSDNEVTVFNGPSVSDISLSTDEAVSKIVVTPKEGAPFTVLIANSSDTNAEHVHAEGEETQAWTGVVHVKN